LLRVAVSLPIFVRIKFPYVLKTQPSRSLMDEVNPPSHRCVLLGKTSPKQKVSHPVGDSSTQRSEVSELSLAEALFFKCAHCH
ncbi:hypothetical protein OFC18_29755, partial [Escherichia coli]|nr:hypothetical protein [Escherichia coli]